MADLNEGYKNAKDKINGLKTFRQAKSDISKITSKLGDSNAAANSDIANPLNKLEEQKNRLQKEVKNQLSQITDLITLNRGNGPETAKTLKKIMVKTLRKIKPEVEEIVIEEIIKVLGCSQQQTYDGNQVFYIKTKTADFKGLLLIDPTSNVGKVKYEKNKDLNYNGLKYPLNRQLFDRIQNEGVDYTFKGASEQELFDISFVQQDNNGVVGNYFKVNLKNRQTAPNKVFEFVRDYYRRINFVDYSIVIGELMNELTGAISMQAQVGVNQTQDNSKFGRILARVLGLCFDNREEIDVSGSSKIGELDNLDDDFFEFTDLDLMKIYQEVSNIQNNSVEIEGCDNIKFPVNSFQIVESIDELNFVDDADDEEVLNKIDNIFNTFLNNPNGIGLTVGVNLALKFDFSFISKLPVSFITTIFSPKVFLGVLIMLKALGKFTSDLDVNSMMDFTKKYKKLLIGLVSKIGSLFVRELFKFLKKEIVTLLKSITKDLGKEQITRKYAVIVSLVAFLIQIIQLIRDWRQCKSILDQILALLKLPSLPGSGVPTPLLFFTNFLPGYSVERSFINSITELQKLGLPTGPLPDGSPNLGLLATYSQLAGQGKELWENAKTEMVIPPLTSPAGPTLPLKWSGKFF